WSRGDLFGALAITTLQTAAPYHLRGRVVGISMLFFTGSIPQATCSPGGSQLAMGLPSACSSAHCSACWPWELVGCGRGLQRRIWLHQLTRNISIQPVPSVARQRPIRRTLPGAAMTQSSARHPSCRGERVDAQVPACRRLSVAALHRCAHL